ncbi:hypothetical protein AKO1_014049 [Acrasis kona]|uniref:Uncharacterized protein n=1 Tax=Acrasis kona TaxID=1008807 RepID=A0AAW2Z351_9EUKA
MNESEYDTKRVKELISKNESFMKRLSTAVKDVTKNTLRQIGIRNADDFSPSLLTNGFVNCGVVITSRGGYTLVYPSALPFAQEIDLVDIVTSLRAAPGPGAFAGWSLEVVGSTLFETVGATRTHPGINVHHGATINSYAVTVEYVHDTYYFSVLTDVVGATTTDRSYGNLPSTKIVLCTDEFSKKVIVLPVDFRVPNLKLTTAFMKLAVKDIHPILPWVPSTSMQLVGNLSVMERLIVRMRMSVYTIERERWNNNLYAIISVSRRNCRDSTMIDYSNINV